MNLLVIAFALWFFFQALGIFMALIATPEPVRSIILFMYCFICGIWLLYANGSLLSR